MNRGKRFGVASGVHRRGAAAAFILRPPQRHHAHMPQKRTRDRVLKQRCLAGERELSRRDEPRENRVHQFIRVIHQQQRWSGKRDSFCAIKIHVAVKPAHGNARDSHEQSVPVRVALRRHGLRAGSSYRRQREPQRLRLSRRPV